MITWLAGLLFTLGSMLLPGCADGRFEDDVPLYWDGSTCGNGVGESFIAIEVGPWLIYITEHGRIEVTPAPSRSDVGRA